MSKITSVSGVLTSPEIKVNFVLYLNEGEPKGADDKVISRILNKASGLSPEMQKIIADFADFLAKIEEKPSGQGPVT